MSYGSVCPLKQGAWVRVTRFGVQNIARVEWVTAETFDQFPVICLWKESTEPWVRLFYDNILTGGEVYRYHEEEEKAIAGMVVNIEVSAVDPADYWAVVAEWGGERDWVDRVVWEKPE